ncbi:dead end protein 1 [Austrofundulus limnaeus]|uniref:Dead end protein 1-like n=1 Tax=Austrofundulus limnaeus TaxID=52670 RepID=A0A2I4C0W8_AUSLI|nr:PREDICTED: dead end protein 1-like [Austrofundulus limnaeus]XP_013873642.1 PREDICTED: dead end protein 1-like [Austrofundulus limnaeus]
MAGQGLPSEVLNAERVQAFEDWLKSSKINLRQVNGQRKYGGPPEVWVGPVPGPHCEIFISQIPRDTYEDILIPLFSSVGPLWEFRLMMNFSGQNRGFAYAKYSTAAVAANAIRLLHGYKLEPGCHLSVRRSTEKRHLCIEDLPVATQQEGLLQVLRNMTGGVERVSLKTGPGVVGVSAIVEYSSHHAASMAKKVLLEEFKKSFSLEVSIRWMSMEKTYPEKQQGLQNSRQNLLPRVFSQASALPLSVCPPPPGFSRVVGGPAALRTLHPPPSSHFWSF